MLKLTSPVRFAANGDADGAALAEDLNKIAAAINRLGVGIGIDPHGTFIVPAAPASLSVVAANGIFDAAITDNSNHGPDLHYFFEYDDAAQFTNPIVVDNGVSRNLKLFLGSVTKFWRAYSQYKGSPQPSAKVTFGSPATGVVGGGAIAPPTQQASQGSGAGLGGGYGIRGSVGNLLR